MKRILPVQIGFLILLALMLTLLLKENRTKNIPLSEAEAAFVSAFSTDGMEKAADMRVKRAFGLNVADYADYLYYAPDNTMSVNELLIVKLLDESQAETVLAAFEARLSEQKTNFDGYGTDQTELLNEAQCFVDGTYACFFVGREALSWKTALTRLWEE